MNILNNDIPKNCKVLKPWGSEYCIISCKSSSTKLLEINPGKKTSLHCHPTKKTGFILLSGDVKVKLGFYDTVYLKSLNKLMIRPGLFHSTINRSNKIAKILEVESPVDKDDLVRLEDDYGRKNRPYESIKNMKKLSSNDIIFQIPKVNNFKTYFLDKCKIKVEKTNDIKFLKKKKDEKIYAILDGGLASKDKKIVLAPGDIVRTDTIKKLSNNFGIKNNILYLEISKK
jgi:mannose-6-phosphate isomerase-like protein (cupin superfamily)